MTHDWPTLRTTHLPDPPAKRPPRRVCRDCGHALSEHNSMDRCFCCHEKRVQAGLPPVMTIDEIKREAPIGTHKRGGTVVEVGGIKLTPVPGLPGRTGPGLYTEVVKAFLASGETCVLVEGRANAGGLATCLREAISVNGSKGECKAVQRQKHCCLVRVKK